MFQFVPAASPSVTGSGASFSTGSQQAAVGSNGSNPVYGPHAPKAPLNMDVS